MYEVKKGECRKKGNDLQFVVENEESVGVVHVVDSMPNDSEEEVAIVSDHVAEYGVVEERDVGREVPLEET
jgi:hypothetical protein